MSYNPLIPQATDLISVSQGEIQANFNAIDNGVSGTGIGFDREHISMTASSYGGMHIQATMPDNAALSAVGTPPINTSTAPLGKPPAPAAGYGTYYASKTGTVGGTITEANYKSGDSSAISILSAVKAWGRFSGTTKADGFNFASVTNSATGVYNITFTNDLPNAVYSVIATVDQAAFANRAIVGATGLATTGFTLNVSSPSTPAGSPSGPVNFIVLQS